MAKYLKILGVISAAAFALAAALGYGPTAQGVRDAICGSAPTADAPDAGVAQ